ncbi:MAG: hypothetical protein M1823_001806 [Watsoniomyces obsoletus]|nr:MAG: hypothetical protein M1823_001806 [Watsoniomyces obsoletus]
MSMPSSFTFNQVGNGDAPFMDGPPRALERLQAFEDDPELLEQHRARRYSSDPPPYSQLASTTVPATPAPESRPVYETVEEESFPWQQFRNQVRQECDRLIHQSLPRLRWRRETLPFDRDLEYMTNAQNNIRSDWVKQGIWKVEWGFAWPKNAGNNNDNRRPPPRQQPPHPPPGSRWGHEEPDTPIPLWEPTAAPPPPSPPLRNLFGSPPQTRRKRRPSPRRSVATTDAGPTAVGTTDVGTTDAGTTGGETMKFDKEASRPIRQFRYQWIKEVQWLTDEPRYQRSSTEDIEEQAYRNVRNTWKGWGIWMKEWGPDPDMEWAHEQARKRQELEAANGSGGGDEVNPNRTFMASVDHANPFHPSHLTHNINHGIDWGGVITDAEYRERLREQQVRPQIQPQWESRNIFGPVQRRSKTPSLISDADEGRGGGEAEGEGEREGGGGGGEAEEGETEQEDAVEDEQAQTIVPASPPPRRRSERIQSRETYTAPGAITASKPTESKKKKKRQHERDDQVAKANRLEPEQTSTRVTKGKSTRLKSTKRARDEEEDQAVEANPPESEHTSTRMTRNKSTRRKSTKRTRNEEEDQAAETNPPEPEQPASKR